MTNEELGKLDDHELILLLHERLGQHFSDHDKDRVARRYWITTSLSALGIAVGAVIAVFLK